MIDDCCWYCRKDVYACRCFEDSAAETVIMEEEEAWIAENADLVNSGCADSETQVSRLDECLF